MDQLCFSALTQAVWLAQLSTLTLRDDFYHEIAFV